MPIECELIWTIECEDCPESFKIRVFGTEFGVDDDRSKVNEKLTDLELFQGWEINRVSYEETEIYCKACALKNKAIAEKSK